MRGAASMMLALKRHACSSSGKISGNSEPGRLSGHLCLFPTASDDLI